MADEDNKNPDEKPSEGVKTPTPENDAGGGMIVDEDIELDEDLAAALSEVDDGGDFDFDATLKEADPDFSEGIGSISKEDFSGVVIERGSAADEVDENQEVPSAYRALWNNMPEEIKSRYYAAIGVVVVLVPMAILIFTGKLLPTFDLPYALTIEEYSNKIYDYPTDGVTVPLFDQFHTKTHTVQLPKTSINLKPVNGRNSYGQFEFSLVLRDEEMSSAIMAKKSEIIDLIQRVLEQITWDEMQTPFGKEKVKKVVRHRINEYLQGNVVLGVYYKSVILDR